MTVQVGSVVGNYRLIKLIGEGGFGEVYLAENPLIGRRAAAKVLHAGMAKNDELVRRFLNEARAASAIQHPNIVQVFDAGATPDGAPYLLMEFLEGQSLHKRLASGDRLRLSQVLTIASQAGSALSAAHDAGIVHRDLKPENLFLVPDPKAPGGQLVKVLDFGIAKMKGSAAGTAQRTQAGTIMGSPAYMSPEQCKDSADVDQRTDLYSFSIILYEMLGGRTPFVSESGTELLVLHLTATPPPLRELAKDVPAHVEAAVMRGLARERERRFQTMAELIAALHGEGHVPANIRTAPTTVMPPGSATPEIAENRAAASTGRTTFSRSTGEVGAKSSDDLLPIRDNSRRWAALGIAGAAVFGAVLFFGLRSHERPTSTESTQTKSATKAAIEPTEPTEPTAVAVPTATEAVAPPARQPDAGIAPQAANVGGTAKKPAPSPVRKTVTVPTTKKGSSEEEWIAH